MGLAHNDCVGACHWRPTEEVREGYRLFRCGGCCSEWVASQAWTPRDADGSVHPEVSAERAAHPS
ncbi:MAG: hypothetical protein Q4G45_10440 [Actinomycetia bacterium]|nr:hypothetical protein [Actinomycetes bacterium]